MCSTFVVFSRNEVNPGLCLPMSLQSFAKMAFASVWHDEHTHLALRCHVAKGCESIEKTALHRFVLGGNGKQTSRIEEESCTHVWKAPAVLRVIDGPLRDHLPRLCKMYKLSDLCTQSWLLSYMFTSYGSYCLRVGMPLRNECPWYALSPQG